MTRCLFALLLIVQKIISVNPRYCWENNYQKEALLFHEMGHCFLGRPDNNELLPSGDPKSLMVAGDINVYSPCVYQIDPEPCNNLPRRSYYIDELFDPNTPLPDWGE